jgi:hypothetical protein
VYRWLPVHRVVSLFHLSYIAVAPSRLLGPRKNLLKHYITVLWQVALLNLPSRRICFVLHWMCLPVFKVETHSSQKSLSWSSSAEGRERDKESMLQIAVRNPNVLRKPDPTPPAENIKEAEMWNLSPVLRTKISERLQLYARLILIQEVLRSYRRIQKCITETGHDRVVPRFFSNNGACSDHFIGHQVSCVVSTVSLNYPAVSY